MVRKPSLRVYVGRCRHRSQGYGTGRGERAVVKGAGVSSACVQHAVGARSWRAWRAQQQHSAKAAQEIAKQG